MHSVQTIIITVHLHLLMELQCEIERDREKGRHMGGGREELREGERAYKCDNVYMYIFHELVCVC